MKRYLVFLLLITIKITVTHGQSNYYAADSVLVNGLQIISADFNLLKVKLSGAIVTFTPDDITEFGLKDGTVYFSREIMIDEMPRKVFLQQLIKGETSLYFYRNKWKSFYFAERDTHNLVVLPKGQLKEHLQTFTSDCNNLGHAARLATYNRGSLKRFFKEYNSCTTPKNFPFLKYGVYFTAGLTQPVFSSGEQYSIFKDMELTPQMKINGGIFAEIPFYNFENLSIYLGAGYDRNNYSSINKSYDTQRLVDINYSAIKIPLLLRYTFSRHKYMPYINAGFTSSIHLQNEGVLYSSRWLNPTTLQMDVPEKEKLHSQHLPGYAAGAGIQFPIDYRRRISLEVRYNQAYSLTPNTFHRNTLELVSGINL